MWTWIERGWSLSLAVGLHATVLFGVPHMLYTPAEYGVEQGVGSVEVHLVAAPLPAAVAAPDLATSDDRAMEELVPAPSPEDPSIRPLENESTGDGTSPDPGKDATTQISSGGAWSDATPGYLRNPAPRYPEAARRMKQQGLVVLLVDVGKDGKVHSLKVAESSGFSLLDVAALEAVRRWRFEPARMGGLAMDSQVQVPVRFRLEEHKDGSS